MWMRLSKGASIALCFVLLFSIMVVLLPEEASADVFTDETDSDFSQGEFGNTEIVGTGPGASVQLNKTLNNWIQMGPPPDPGAREGPAYCFDEVGGVMVIFGGYGSGGYRDDTWEYDLSSNTWTEIGTDPTPPPREWGGMAYDSANELCILFGGWGSSGILKDTWEYDVYANTWEDTTPFFGPDTMSSSPLAFDSSARRVILVGEDFTSGTMQTWAYDASLDVWTFQTGGSPSPSRASHAIVYDTSIGKTVLFGGIEGGFPPVYHGDTWEYEYSTNTWTYKGTGGPTARAGHAMTYKSSENAVYLFGGNMDADFYSDTWKRQSGSWSRVNVIKSPPGRASPALVNDGGNDYVIMCCGFDSSQRYNDTWALGSFYTFQGFFTSRIFDAVSASVNYTALYLNQSEGMWPEETEIRIRIASSISVDGPWDFWGPDGTVNTHFNQSVNPIPDFHYNHRYIRYRATLITYDGKYSPALQNVSISYEIPPSPPYLAETYPENAKFNVNTSTCIYLNFSEMMKRSSVTVDIWYLNPLESTGITFTWTWSNGDTTLTLCPQTDFLESKVVQVWVNGTDMEGLDLVPNPWDPSVVNPFAFVTTAGEPPRILSTNPAHQETDVSNDTNVVITWSEPMEMSSVTWRINQGTDPNPGNWTESWDPADTVLTLSHATPFVECDDLEFEILTATDKSGNGFINVGAPNPWSFKIACISPYVTSTDPYDGQWDIPVNYPITVIFSEPMAPGTLVHGISPNVTLSPSWSDFDRQLTVNHGNFQSPETYEYCIYDVQDKEGYHLLDRPYCFSFTTVSANPFIAFTNPADGETDVDPSQDVIITFSEVMNTGSVTWTLYPNEPDKAEWVEVWDYDQVLFLKHARPMLYCSDYTFEVTAGRDQSGLPLIPGPVPNPWSFTTTFEYPCIIATDPQDGNTSVDLWKEISITFDEPIDTTRPFVFTVSPVLNGTVWTTIWSNGDRTVTLNHSKRLPSNSRIEVSVFEAYDLDGNPLQNGPIPNPFHFWTTTDPNWPWINATSPANRELFVPTDVPIVIWFSETMDIATVTWDVQDLDNLSPDFTPIWSQTTNPDDTLTLTHVEPFRECQTYSVLIDGQDLDGNPLQNHPTDPNVSNPFSFDTICVLPVIMRTDPADKEVNVPLNKSIVIEFSEEMQPATLRWWISPDPNPGTWTETWSSGNTTVTLGHTNDFTQCTIHDIEVTQAWDLDDNAIIPGPVPNPWSFTTECINPYIVSTDPYDGETGVPQDKDVIVVFSEPMDTASVVFQIQPSLPFNETWSNNDTVLTISHDDLLLECKLYDAGISSGTDKDGNPLIPGPSPVPNPWSFTTVCVNPWVNETYPADGDMNVPLDAPIIIDFSEPMNTVTVSIDVDPNPGSAWTKEWANNNMTFWMNHSVYYNTCDQINVTILSGQDPAGLDLIPLPYRWSFMVECPNPYIVWTDPIDGEVNVELDRDIQILFSDPMDTLTVTLTILPDPGGWTRSWYQSDTLLVLTHSNLFRPETIHTVEVTNGDDKDGYPLIPGLVPNPWRFKTRSELPPEVILTDPDNNEMGVSIWKNVLIQFNKEIVPGTFHWNVTVGQDPGNWSESWSQTVEPNDTVTLIHATPFDPSTPYCFRIEHARDLFGQDMLAPYNFCFVTGTILEAPTGLAVTKISGVVKLTWNLVSGATHYNIYDSTDKFASFPSGWNMNQVADPTNTYDFAYLGDGLTHYFIVRAYDSGSAEESTNSTMGVKIEKSFTIDPIRANIFWMSLPFVSEYTRASDIANELTQANVNIIAKWDRDKQQVVSYYYARGKWRGRDFTLSAGDGIYISAIANFNWDIVGTDSDASISLPYSGLPTKQNKHWISVPYTGVYTRASDIVVDIEGGLGPGRNTYIIEVGLWDSVAQRERTYSYAPTGWSGDNFVLSPGDGIYLRMVQSYIWPPVLVTPYVP